MANWRQCVVKHMYLCSKVRGVCLSSRGKFKSSFRVSHSLTNKYTAEEGERGGGKRGKSDNLLT